MNRLRLWLIYTVFSLALVPVVVFLGGWWLAGPYEGEGGVFSMMGQIYRDALTGHAGALLMLLAPLLLVAIWQGAFWLRSGISAAQARDDESARVQGQ